MCVVNLCRIFHKIFIFIRKRARTPTDCNCNLFRQLSLIVIVPPTDSNCNYVNISACLFRGDLAILYIKYEISNSLQIPPSQMLYSMNGSVVGLVKIDDMVSRLNDATDFFLTMYLRLYACKLKKTVICYHFQTTLPTSLKIQVFMFLFSWE